MGRMYRDLETDRQVRQRTKQIAAGAAVTPKQFREILNKEFGFTDERWGVRGAFGALKRLYGDYLYHQDREIFNMMYERHLSGEEVRPVK